MTDATRAADRLRADADLVPRTFGTRLLRTHVRADGDGGYVWTRTPGDAAPHPFVAHDVPAAAALRALVPGGAGTRLAWGRPEGEARTYRARGAQSVAGHLLAGGDGRHAPCLRGLGEVLRAVHAVGSASATDGLGSPRGLRRLAGWLDGGPVTGSAEEVREQVHGVLGAARWALLRERCHAATAADATLCHGAPGLGSLVPDAEGEGAVLLTGEDLAVAPWQLDVAWVVGELVELTWQLPGSASACHALLDAFHEGYGRDLGDDWPSWSALRIALHLHDFSAYVAAPLSEAVAYASFVGYLLDAS